MLRKTLFAVSALLLAACAGTPHETASTGPSSCFRAEDVNGYNVIDREHVGVRVGANRRYVLTTNWNTSDLDWTETIALRSSTGRICTGNGLGVEIIGGRPPRNYVVTGIERAPDDAPGSEGS
ncbi:MAG: DUF6491 family protein [Hyphomonadaceae bacterium]